MPSPRNRRLVWALLLAVLLAACGGDGEVRWRDLRLELPDGWVVFEEEDSRLSIANAPLGVGSDIEEIRDQDVVALFFTHEPDASPDAWRRLIEGVDGAELESDRRIDLGGVPATELVWSQAFGSGQPTREMVIVVPPRQVVVLAQPVPLPGDTDAPEVFDAHRDVIDGILGSVRWGAPVDGPGTVPGG